MRPCLVALGGNVGPVEKTFAQAVESLRLLPGIVVDAVSTTFCTTPVGANAGDTFLNAVVQLSTTLAPLELLDRLQQIENASGRVRDSRRGPRTLDLDLITFDDAIIEESLLTVPHPACWYRRFVLDPAVEIAAAVVHPVIQKTFGELRERLLPRPLPVELSGGDASGRRRFAERLLTPFPAETVTLVDESGDSAVAFAIDRPPADSTRAATSQFPRLQLPDSDFDEQFDFVRDVLTAALGWAGETAESW